MLSRSVSEIRLEVAIICSTHALIDEAFVLAQLFRNLTVPLSRDTVRRCLRPMFGVFEACFQFRMKDLILPHTSVIPHL